MYTQGHITDGTAQIMIFLHFRQEMKSKSSGTKKGNGEMGLKLVKIHMEDQSEGKLMHC